jgi:hypothetical protein
MAIIGIECSELGTQLVVDLGKQEVESTITPLPFIDNRKKVWRGIMDD